MVRRERERCPDLNGKRMKLISFEQTYIYRIEILTKRRHLSDVDVVADEGQQATYPCGQRRVKVPG